MLHVSPRSGSARLPDRVSAHYQVGFRFGQLGYELVERRGLKRFEASTYLSFSIYVLRGTKHVAG